MKLIITGASGMVGQAVLLECLDDASVTEVLVINRRPIDKPNVKLKELLVQEFADMAAHADHLKGYDACLHCMGVSAMGMSEQEYTTITYGYTKILADVLYGNNPDMTMIYVSGVGTDSSEKGRSMWARVKGRTENYVLNKGFKDAYAFRPGLILTEKGVKSRTGWYNTAYAVLRPFYSVLGKLNNANTSSELGKAMLVLCQKPNAKKVIHPVDITRLSL
ncbi:NAD-dependent epimerase/dehydratase family protein [Dyadobacter jejuensis]|uniref:NAD-dependent epimerase/dehydratase family protein n=1 Tax=Dyadobacter jejuensis TaxID=1082580 RepID=A0A316B7S1_9BACT|nr:NAD-dependent epimerase/dehydratase family protein [Dyadobacter jejuensis]PWJ58657.1 NAD-dependent epimerase/dehydratase family protein [Dyadobacter jejuensis]